MSSDLRDLERKIGYYFNDRTILKEAVTHGSARAVDRSRPHHERLEFLGDSVLSTVISEYFFKRESVATPGDLTQMRKTLITDRTQNLIAERLEIWKYVERSSGLPSQFGRWGEFVEAIIGAVYVDAGMGDGDGLKKAKEVIYKLWNLEYETIRLENASGCSVM